MEALQKAKYHAIQYDTMPDGKLYYTSPFIMHTYSDAAGCTKNYAYSDYELFQRELQDPCYDFFRDDPEFIALTE